MKVLPDYLTPAVIEAQVRMALDEDIQTGDITAEFCPITVVVAHIITREAGILCGQPWVRALCSLYPEVDCTWLVNDGAMLAPQQVICTLSGPTRTLLTIERSILNFLQCLSGTASATHLFAQAIAHTPTRLFDTRKTIPGLRLAQKYAVLCGGGHNHRLGLYDAILLKENHITSLGSVSKAIQRAHEKHAWVEIEVETLDQLQEALSVGVERILLDNFTLLDMKTAVQITNNQTTLEASGNININTIVPVAETGVDIISCGALTKNITALDLSYRITMKSSPWGARWQDTALNYEEMERCNVR